ncbi:peptidylprolyl isomerase [Dissulfurirhabdus thermomarina]|uniref:peptidylprolyl isomerase n=1 Tax=Dissulfurirhabdus thermomarina TaxID=1765737 RepID=A0A6N9TPY5_DISTH|nr:peptidylprolyl isomerase [Dissulfurirhabdus thermomarina]NDY41804.1 peptidylprolyl isomerase [Dissulfurirhabdus thermomarina]NMX24055.1 peptidylprolyl isomerase [Dissulfurirhabdus thermomarina]
MRNLILAAVLLLAMACGPANGDDKDGGVLARVGPYQMTLDQFRRNLASLPPQMKMMLAQDPSLQEKYLERWVQITLLAQEARARKLDRLPEVKARMDDLANTVLAQEMLEREIGAKVSVTDEELKAYYAENKDKFAQPEMVRARHILIRVGQGADEKTRAKAEAKARDIRKQIRKGADFADLAKKYSEDPGTRDKGGELGFFPKGRMVPEFEKAAFALKKGEVSQPVRTAFGYHLIQVEDRKAASVPTLASVEGQVRQQLQQEKQQEALDALLADLEKRYKPEVHKEVLKQADAGTGGGSGTK